MGLRIKQESCYDNRTYFNFSYCFIDTTCSFFLGISIGLFQVPVIGAMQMYATETGLENGMSLNSIQTSIDIRTIYLMYKYWKHNWTHNWRVFCTLFNIPLDEPSLGNYHFH